MPHTDADDGEILLLRREWMLPAETAARAASGARPVPPIGRTDTPARRPVAANDSKPIWPLFAQFLTARNA